MANIFDEFAQSLGGMSQQDKTKFVTLVNRVEKLEKSNQAHREAFQKVNALLKEIIGKLEG